MKPARHPISAGDRFGRGVVIDAAIWRKRRSGTRRDGYVRLRCDCGSEYETQPVHLQDGKTRSCGCLAREVHAESLRSRATTHGLSRHALFHTWAGMLERCENPDHEAYARYGARGITVCPEWHDVAAFITWIEANLGPRPEGQSLDRKDNDLGYLPGNVRWADSREQSRNSTRYGLTAAGRQARDRQIAKLRAGGMSYAAIGRQMGGAS